MSVHTDKFLDQTFGCLIYTVHDRMSQYDLNFKI